MNQCLGASLDLILGSLRVASPETLFKKKIRLKKYLGLRLVA
jgi:hypothetical protein